MMRFCCKGSCVYESAFDTSNFCPIDGTELTTAPKCLCGEAYDPRPNSPWRFCRGCGLPLAMGNAEATPAPDGKAQGGN